ncbi:MAG: FAD:protein FMN transferase [Planctomycetota bacterium]|nr:FAD:protein FMN transferase [Planctomycetota bacterium]
MDQQPPSANRREFLLGQSAARAAVAAIRRVVDAAEGTEEPTEPGSDGALIEATLQADTFLTHYARQAMACEFEVIFNVATASAANNAAFAALDLIDRLEDQMTVYREHSEISRLNRTAAHRAVTVEPRLFATLQMAVDRYRETEGAYDITSGPLSKLWGFYRRAGKLPTQQEITESLSHVGSDKLELDTSDHTFRFLDDKVEINLGSIGKGYALDRAAEVMEQQGVTSFLLHGGQSSILARGAASTASTTPGWWIGVRHPLRPQQRLAQVRVVNRALATSGSGVQFFVQAGKRYGHILDPRTGWPAEGTLSATVVAPTAAEADAMSTAFYVMGLDESVRYCQNRPDLGLILVRRGTNAGSVEVTTVGIDETDLQWNSDRPIREV